MNVPSAFLATVLACIGPHSIHAQLITDVIPAGKRHTITLRENQAMEIWRYRPSPHSPPYLTMVTTEGKKNALFLAATGADDPVYLAGPCELELDNAVKHFISYRLLSNTTVKTVFLRAGEQKAVTIPTGTRARFFRPVPDYFIHDVNVTISDDDESIDNLKIVFHSPFEMAGPVVVSFKRDGSATDVLTYSYAVLADFEAASDVAARPAAGNGNHAIAVERSIDLKTWTPALIHTGSTLAPVFYRFRID